MSKPTILFHGREYLVVPCEYEATCSKCAFSDVPFCPETGNGHLLCDDFVCTVRFELLSHEK